MERPDYLARFPATMQYRTNSMIASARRMRKAGLDLYLCAAEKHLLADVEEAAATHDAKPIRANRGQRHWHIERPASSADDGLSAQYEPLMYH